MAIPTRSEEGESCSRCSEAAAPLLQLHPLSQVVAITTPHAPDQQEGWSPAAVGRAGKPGGPGRRRRGEGARIEAAGIIGSGRRPSRPRGRRGGRSSSGRPSTPLVCKLIRVDWRGLSPLQVRFPLNPLQTSSILSERV